MTVLRRGNSKNWYIQFQLSGKTFVRSARTTSRKAAEQMETQMRAQAHAERFLGFKTSTTFGEALRRFIETKEGAPSHRNLLSQQRVMAKHFAMSAPLETLTSQQVEEFRRSRSQAGAGSQTIKHGLNLIRGAWKLAKQQGYRVGDLTFPSVKLSAGRLRYLTIGEERRLLTELDPRREGRGLAPFDQRADRVKAAMQDAYDVVVVLLDTGARYGEIAKLTWKQIDLDKALIHLWRPKVRNESVIFMTDRVVETLRRRYEARKSDHVFGNKTGSARGYTHVSMRKAFNRAGLHDCTIHTLRHTHATRLIQNGLSIYEVQAVLGHTDAKTTMRYAHLEQARVTAKARDVINRLSLANEAEMGKLITFPGR